MKNRRLSIGNATGKRTRRRQAGQTLMLAALTLPGLAALTGLVLDGGMIYQVKRRMQSAADAAALGGAQELWRLNTSTVTEAARTDARLNGFEDGVNNTTVTVNNPPLSGPRAGNSNFVEVIISREVSTTMLRMVGRNASTVRSRAVAGLVKAADGCVLALNPTDPGTLVASGGSSLVAGCSVQVNSSNDKAIELNGGGCITASDVAVAGGWTSGCVSPTPTVGVPPALDPLAYMTPPTVSSTPVATYLLNGVLQTLKKNEVLSISGGVAVLSPGTYSGGISISGGTVTFLPGVYILDGGGLKISGNSVVSGDGVMFYNTNTGAGGAWGHFDISGTAKVDFRAPDSGTYEGILFWSDKNEPYKNNGSTISGTSDSRFEGAMYFPSTAVTYSGTSTAAAWQMIIGYTVKLSGGAVVTSDYDATTIQVPTRKATLVE